MFNVSHDPKAAPLREQRRQLFIAPKAQGFLLFRIMLYCIASSCSTAVLCAVAVCNSPVPMAWSVWIGGPVLAMLVTIPWLLYDAAATSNRIVGPFARVQRAVRQLANGDPVSSINVRAHDLYWDDWMQDFNQMVTRIQLRQSECSPVASGERNP